MLIGLEESCDMENAISFDSESDLVKERDENIDGDLRFIFSKIGDQELMVIFFDPE